MASFLIFATKAETEKCLFQVMMVKRAPQEHPEVQVLPANKGRLGRPEMRAPSGRQAPLVLLVSPDLLETEGRTGHQGSRDNLDLLDLLVSVDFVGNSCRTDVINITS